MLSVVISVLLVLGVACCLEKSTKISAVDWIPVLFFSIITVLFFFYCADMLFLGRMTVYVLLVAASVGSLLVVKRKDGRISFDIRCVFSPAMCVFVLVCGMMCLYTSGMHTIFFDDLRLWAAVPRVLWSTERLQLGENSAIYLLMQSYPPGMPLFVYFLSALAPVYHEFYAFWCYGIFAAILFVPSMIKLEFRPKPLFVIMALLVMAVPCYFSSHGGDGSYYYCSLYIDTVLGMLAGYCFYLSATKPFQNAFTILRFSTTLAVVVLLKDSGAGFASAAAVNAIILAFIDGRDCRIQRRIVGSVCAAGTIFVAFFRWQNLIEAFGANTNLGVSVRLPSRSLIEEVITSSLQMPIWKFVFPKSGRYISVAFPLAACIGLVFLGSVFLRRKYHDISKRAAFCTELIMTAFSLAFIIGMCITFYLGIPCFQRYTGAIASCAGMYLLLRWIPIIICQENVSWDMQRSGACICILMILIFVNYRSGGGRAHPQVPQADYHMEQIMDQCPAETENGREKMYLFFAVDDLFSGRLQQMIYFRSLDNCLVAGNYYTDLCFRDSEADPENIDAAAAAARQWLDRLVSEGYTYIYVVLSDDYSEKAMARIGAGDDFTAETLYRLNADGTIHSVS